MMKYLLSVLYLIFTSLGVLFMKLGGDSISISLKNSIQFKMGYLTLIGFVAYLFSFLLWQKLLVTYNLSFIVPVLTGLSQVIVLLMSLFFFKEAVNVYNIVGVILIIIGISLIALKGNV